MHPTTNESSKRIFGFDIIRSSAIIIVVLAHSNYLIRGLSNYFPNFNPPDGVDLFFVLSGFLIGNIIIRSFEKNQKIELPAILHFLKRRWFRTLPNYFLFLGINIAFIYFGLIAGTLNKYLSTYFVFFQNFLKPYDFLFWESWSITIEEWFYLLFPLTLFIVYKLNVFKKKQYVFLFTIVCFILLPLIIRIIKADANLNTDLFFRKLVITRLDAIGYGLLGAYLSYYFETAWMSYKNLLFVLGLISIFIIQNIVVENTFYHQTFIFSLSAFSILLTFPKMASIKEEKIPLKPFQFISKISYSLYFVHPIVLQLINKYYTNDVINAKLWLYLPFWLICIICSFIIYKFFEKPFMNLRDKI